MAYQKGTATDHVDLFDKLIEFLTNDPELVYSGQNWTVAWSKASDLAEGAVLQGPGLAATDEILVGVRMQANIADDNASITFVGMTGVIPSSDGYKDHVNVMPVGTRLMLRTQAMDYWFVANGRRFMVMVRVSTVYEAMYAGFFLPYCAPPQYPYPLFVGGSAHDLSSAPDTVSSWRSTADSHAHYTRSAASTSAITGRPGNGWMVDPSGNWLNAGISSVGQCLLGPGFFGTGDFDISSGSGANNYGYGTLLNRVIPAYGDEHALVPITLLQQSPNDQAYGVLDGVYRVGGRGNAPENTIVVDGVTHVVGINAFRTGIADFWAMELGVVP